jgi:hypothetical protein
MAEPATALSKAKARLVSAGLAVRSVAGDVKDQVKQSLGHMSTSLQTTMAGVTDGSGVSVVDKVMTAKRRAEQLALQKLGRTEASEDPEFDALVESLYEMKVNLNTLADHLTVFLNAVRGAAVCVPRQGKGENPLGSVRGGGGGPSCVPAWATAADPGPCADPFPCVCYCCMCLCCGTGRCRVAAPWAGRRPVRCAHVADGPHAAFPLLFLRARAWQPWGWFRRTLPAIFTCYLTEVHQR